MAKPVVYIARLVTFRTLTIHRVKLVSLAHTVIKCFKLPMLLAKHARQARIRPPKACPVLPGATIVPRANIQWKKATRNR